MVVSAGVSMLLFGFGLTIPQLFLATALFNAVVAIYIYSLVPEFLQRFIVWMLIHTVYCLERQGIDEHIPDEGPALIVCNHVSYVDALVIMAACRRPIRFVMDHKVFKVPVLRFVFRESRAIPIASAKEDPELLDKAFDEVAAALAAGELVGIFPEGGITGNGEVQPFRPGVSRILDRTPVPVIPLSLRGLWGSYFSRIEGEAMKKPFRRGFFSKIGLAAAPAVPPEQATPEHLQAVVAGLRGDWK
jgi:1-acyl-sn-glycerol-3-phosphate acyltransferase